MANWYERVREEIEALLAARVETTNVTWETGRVPDDDPERVTADFVGTQYAPWYDGGVWSVGAEEWNDGNQKAAAYYQGKGVRWTFDQITVLPRTPDEAAVMFRVNHWERGNSLPAQALFLEAWVRQDGSWQLLRHLAEKARRPRDE